MLPDYGMILNMKSSQLRLISLILSLLLTVSFIIIFYLARGYKFDFESRRLRGTGILVVNSSPDGAMVYLNDKPYSATNTSISNLRPGIYRVKIQKQGYHAWYKEIAIEQEVVSKINALLAPLFPELKPLSYTTTTKPILSPDGQKILFTAQGKKENSLWLLELSERPFNLINRPRLLIKDKPDLAYSKMEVHWAPDSKLVLLQESPTEAFLLDTITANIQEIKNPQLTLNQWNKELEQEEKVLLQNLPPSLREKVKGAPWYSWSPDKNALIYRQDNDEEQLFRVIDLKPNFTTLPTRAWETKQPDFQEKTVFSFPRSQFIKVLWYPDSRHFIILEKEQLNTPQGKLILVEIDGENKNEFFSGVIQADYVFPFPSGTKVALLTSFDPAQKAFNLYSLRLY